jgi:hypothetical protein
LRILRELFPDAAASKLPKDWDTRRVSIAEAEAEHMVTDKRPEPVPFGFLNQEWKALLAQMIEGDELWLFRSSPESWATLRGREGIALVRKGEVIERVVTGEN